MKSSKSNKPDDRAARRDAFGKKMIDILNGGAVNAAMAIGYRTGLFDAMDSMDEAAPLMNITQKAGLQERYVREWMGIMVTAGVVVMGRSDGDVNLYRLPKAHGDLLARRSGNSNMGVYTQEIPLLTASVMEDVIDGFYSGRGVSYDRYPKFQTFMAELADAKHRQVLVDTFLPSVDNGRMVKRLADGIRVCDLGCAEGVALLLMAAAFPKSRFIGFDISREAIEKAKKDGARQNLSNAAFMLLDAATLIDTEDHRENFDYVTAFDAIHDQTRPMEALKGVYRILAPGGVFSMVDIAARTDVADNMDHPMGSFLYTVSLLHCMPVGLSDGGLGLGMMWGREKAVEMLDAAGFKNIEVEEIPDDPFNLHFMGRK
jgi:ubiquinone/menaquinone biosynthesis C-methylase UbiE